MSPLRQGRNGFIRATVVNDAYALIPLSGVIPRPSSPPMGHSTTQASWVLAQETWRWHSGSCIWFETQLADVAAMTSVEEIAKAVAELSTDQLARFRAWFEEFEAARFDGRIECDAKAGKLDRLAEQALADFHAGRAREL